MSEQELPEEIIDLLRSVSGKRARVVIEHILEHGFITTEELEKTYGYDHPPRAVRDVREAGIPLETCRVKSSDGRSIGAYRFGDLTKIQKDRLGGRRVFSKQFKDTLYEASGRRCAICSGHFEARYLQIDHRTPYEVSGEQEPLDRNLQDYMLVCGSCNRAKSWSCEHCPNWKIEKSPQICANCYWASPEDYVHIALREVRRTDIFWSGNEIETYERLKRLAREERVRIPDFVKRIVTRYLGETDA